MRLVPALFLAALIASPALGQDATTPAAPAEPAPAAPAEPAPAAPAAPAPVTLPAMADISPTADRDFWCAIAFSLTTRAAQMNGDQATAQSEAAKSQIVFAGVVTAMKAGNFSEEQFNALTSQYTAKVLDPFAAPEAGFTREQCEAAVPEAEAAVTAAQPAAPADPAAPAAPADPATPDAPAAGAPAADAPGTEAPQTSQ